MVRRRRFSWAAHVLGGLGLMGLVLSSPGLHGQQVLSQSAPRPGVFSYVRPAADCTAKTLPINMPTALRLANVAPLDIAVAAQRIRVAAAQMQQARALWLPTVYVGVDYFRHDGKIQDTAGNVVGASKSSFMAGAGPSAVFALSDALFAPLAQRQVLRARQADLESARNNTLEAVAETYFNLQQARGELTGAVDAAQRAEQVTRKIEVLAQGLAPPVEAPRARTELARRRQAIQIAWEHWRAASADLVRLLRLDPAVLLDPLEPPHLQVTLVGPGQTLDELIVLALTSRPELAAQQALVQATLQRLRQERIRPLVPSVLLRGASTPVTGTLAGGVFGGGSNGNVGSFSARSDFDVQVLWELRNLGFGNRARIKEQQAEHELSILELFRVQDGVAAQVAQAHAQVQSAAARLGDAESELRDATESAGKNYEGLGQTKSLGGNLLVLVIRPQEAVQAVQALSQAYNDYYGAIADYNRAQFRLYRALGRPAQAVVGALGKE